MWRVAHDVACGMWRARRMEPHQGQGGREGALIAGMHTSGHAGHSAIWRGIDLQACHTRVASMWWMLAQARQGNASASTRAQ